MICPALNLIKYVEWRRLPALLFGTGAVRAWAVLWACATMSWDLLVLLSQPWVAWGLVGEKDEMLFFPAVPVLQLPGKRRMLWAFLGAAAGMN